jgi:hypothetical protein
MSIDYDAASLTLTAHGSVDLIIRPRNTAAHCTRALAARTARARARRCAVRALYARGGISQ